MQASALTKSAPLASAVLSASLQYDKLFQSFRQCNALINKILIELTFIHFQELDAYGRITLN